jgi:hypothetical protein
MREVFRLPNGKTTVSVRRYIRAWRDVARPIERLTNSKLFGFDPDLSFMQQTPANTSTGYREFYWRLDADKAILFGNLANEVEDLREEIKNCKRFIGEMGG